MAIPLKVAQQWFAFNQGLITNDNITWNQYKTAFLAGCPTENNEDYLSFAEII